jgi:hypothetical protein
MYVYDEALMPSAMPEALITDGCSSGMQVIRVMFRFLFTTPLLVLGIDVISGRFRVVRNKCVGTSSSMVNLAVC